MGSSTARARLIARGERCRSCQGFEHGASSPHRQRGETSQRPWVRARRELCPGSGAPRAATPKAGRRGTPPPGRAEWYRVTRAVSCGGSGSAGPGRAPGVTRQVSCAASSEAQSRYSARRRRSTPSSESPPLVSLVSLAAGACRSFAVSEQAASVPLGVPFALDFTPSGCRPGRSAPDPLERQSRSGAAEERNVAGVSPSFVGGCPARYHARRHA